MYITFQVTLIKKIYKKLIITSGKIPLEAQFSLDCWDAASPYTVPRTN